MARTIVFLSRRASRRVQVTARGGAVRTLQVAPVEFEWTSASPIALTERQGQKSITRVAGRQNSELSFDVHVGHVDWTRSCQGQLDWLGAQYRAGKQIKFSGMPPEFAGWWAIRRLRIKVTQMTPDHKASRATLSFDLVEAVDVKAPVIKKAKTPPKAKTPVYRTHRVVQGDWLSKIAGRCLGNIHRWPEIYRLNKSKIRDPNRIYPGQVFRIPPK